MTTNTTLQRTKISLATAFGLPQFPPEAMIDGFTGPHPALPPKKLYVFQLEKLRDIMAFWTSGLIALKVQGDPATGKTSLVEQWHARLGWPLYKIPCSSDTTASHLIGGMLPTAEGTLKWFDGPVLKAAKEGTSVLLDEYNTLQPAETTGLNMLLEGYSITIAQTGEVVTPQPGFRVFATENDIQSRLNVTGRNMQDAANDDRWMVMQADYLPRDLEIQVVKDALLQASPKRNEPKVIAAIEMLATQVVDLANTIRVSYRKEENGIDKPMSTRTAVRWALLVGRYQKVKPEEGGPTIYALHRAFAMSKEMAAIVDVKARAKLGTTG